MRLGLGRHCIVSLALGVGLGWIGARVVLPTPSLILLSPRVQCGGPHEVSVPMAENVQWAVQSGKRWWVTGKGWGAAPEWHAGPGKVIAGPAPEGVRLAMKGFRSGNVAGTLIRGVKVEAPEGDKKATTKEKSS